MPHLTVPEDTFRRLAAKADALNISVDDLVQPALDRLAETGTSRAPYSASSPNSRRSSSSRKCWSEPTLVTAACHTTPGPHRVGPSVIVAFRLASRPHRRPGLLNRRVHRRCRRRAGSPWSEQMDRKMLRNVEKRGVQAARNGPSEDGKRWQRVGLGIHSLKSWGRKWSRKVRETRSSGSQQCPQNTWCS